MHKLIDDCVDCPREIGCLGNSCPYRKVNKWYCDNCGDENAEYRIDHDDYCPECAEAYLQDLFDDLSLEEKAELLNVDLSDISGAAYDNYD